MTDFRNCAATAGIALLLCACAERAGYGPQANTVSQSPARPSESPARARATLYVANVHTSSGDLTGYSLATHAMTYSTSTDLNEPEGIATDAAGAVYVANTYGYDILKFVPPATSPVLKIKDRRFRPTDVAIDSNGDIWVANWCTRKPSCGPGNVQEYSATGKLLHAIRCANLTYYTFLATDKKDDIVVDGEGPYSEYSDAGEIAAGTTHCKTLDSIHVASPGGVEFTSDGNVTVIDQVDVVMRTYAAPHFTNILYVTPFYGVPTPTEDAFVKGDQTFWTSVQGYNGVFEFSYPNGGSPIDSIEGIYFPTGVAIAARK